MTHDRVEDIFQRDVGECIIAAARILNKKVDVPEIRKVAEQAASESNLSPIRLLASGLGISATFFQIGAARSIQGFGPILVRTSAGRAALVYHAPGRNLPKIIYPLDAQGAGDGGGEIDEILEAYELGDADYGVDKRARTNSATGIGHLLEWKRPIPAFILQCLVISVFGQIYIVLNPMYLRYVVDEVLVGGGHAALTAVAAGFAMLALFNCVGTILKEVAFQALGNELSWVMYRKVFFRLLCLPLSWFSKHQLSDVLSRLSGLDNARSVITGMLQAAFESIILITSMAILFIVSWKMALVAIISQFVLLAIRIMAVSRALRLNRLAIQASVSEQGKRIESVRAIATIKSLGLEANRGLDWLQDLRLALTASRDSSVYMTAVLGITTSATAGAYIISVYLGALDVISGSMTIGLLTASLAYSAQVFQSAANLFTQITAWKMLDVQLERLGDIVQHPIEPGLDFAEPAPGEKVNGQLAVRNLRFRFEEGGTALFENVTFDVAAGEHVALVGESGCGKSTLIKLITGLYTPEDGDVILDGTSIGVLGPKFVRRMIGVVQQDDELFSGSILDNIIMYERERNTDFAWECLRAASLYIDVNALPSGINTKVGEGGVALSGGQKQRLMIARVLYRKPSILIMDESTSHLDMENEGVVMMSLNMMKITRITVAHRPQTIAMADRVIRLGKTGIAED